MAEKINDKCSMRRREKKMKLQSEKVRLGKLCRLKWIKKDV